MDEVAVAFKNGAQRDVMNWNCEAMYPRPQPHNFGPKWMDGKWLGAASDLAKKGFNIYNMVKKFIPGGSTAGKGSVPGSPAELELTELGEAEWGQVVEKAFGMGKKLLDMMKGPGADMTERL
jgi:hypothetical protein